MHKNITIIFLIIITVFLIKISNSYYKKDNFIQTGTWSGASNNFKIILDIKNNNHCSVLIEYFRSINSDYLEGVCIFDFSKKPFALDIISIQNQPSLHTVFKIMDKKKIKISKFSPNSKFRDLIVDEINYIILNKY